MKLSHIKKAATTAVNLLKAEGAKTALLVLRASIEDLKAERDTFHLNNVLELALEIKDDLLLDISSKTRTKLNALAVACAEELKEVT